MKSTMLRRALDLLEPAVCKTVRSFIRTRLDPLSGFCLGLGVFFDLLTSLHGALLSLRAGKGVDKVGEGAVAAEQLLVGATLGNFSICHNQNMVGLWQEAHPVGHKNAGLHGEPHKRRKK